MFTLKKRKKIKSEKKPKAEKKRSRLSEFGKRKQLQNYCNNMEFITEFDGKKIKTVCPAFITPTQVLVIEDECETTLIKPLNFTNNSTNEQFNPHDNEETQEQQSFNEKEENSDENSEENQH